MALFNGKIIVRPGLRWLRTFKGARNGYGRVSLWWSPGCQGFTDVVDLDVSPFCHIWRYYYTHILIVYCSFLMVEMFFMYRIYQACNIVSSDFPMAGWRLDPWIAGSGRPWKGLGSRTSSQAWASACCLESRPSLESWVQLANSSWFKWQKWRCCNHHIYKWL